MCTRAASVALLVGAALAGCAVESAPLPVPSDLPSDHHSTTPDSGPDDTSAGGTEAELGLFSFFVTSRVALQDLSGSEHGFGGDLRYGETGPGAGLRGADRICAEIADRSMPGASTKGWRAFLSASEGEDGEPVHAIDRIGAGPWYDRIGRLVATSPADLQFARPRNGDPDIADDLPNENGVPNSEVDPGADIASERNHHMLTGSAVDGTLYPSLCIEESIREGLVDACDLECKRTGGLSIEQYVCENCELPIEDLSLLEEFCRSACAGPDGYHADCEAPVNSNCNSWTTSAGASTESRPRVGLSWPRPDRSVDQGWASWWSVGGCAPVGSTEGGEGRPEVGQPGSYGGFYCFALEP